MERMNAVLHSEPDHCTLTLLHQDISQVFIPLVCRTTFLCILFIKSPSIISILTELSLLVISEDLSACYVCERLSVCELLELVVRSV